MKRIDLLYKMDGLLDQCKSCEKNQAVGSPEVRCKGCSIYDELRGIGNQLGRVDKLTLTKESYQDLKAKGLTDADIAKQFGVSPGTITYRRKQWFQTEQKVVEQPEVTITPKPLPNKKESSTNEYESLKQQISLLVKTSEQKQLIIEKLEAKVQELEHVHNACEDVEKESARFRKERDTYLQQLLDARHKLHQKDYLVENQANVIENTRKTLERYERENKAFRELIALWV
jgi:valyl-tRNA synthetase